MITESEIQKFEDNWDKLIGLVGRVRDEDNREKLLSLCNKVKDRMQVAPASTKTEYHGAYPGGLVDMSLKTVKMMNKLNKAYDADISIDSIIICGLFANLGKIGSEKDDLYLVQESQWHRDHGIMYTFDRKVGVMPAPSRSLWWLTITSGVKLTPSEFNAISSLSTMGSIPQDSNALFGTDLLSVCLQNAVRVIAIQGAFGTSVLD